MPLFDVKTELVNPETELRKVAATCEGKTFCVKGRMKTADEKKAIYDNLWNQYLKSIEVVPDKFADDTRIDLEKRMV